jgi:hypothetical protein
MSKTAKEEYKELVTAISEKVAKSGSRSSSKQDLTKIAQAYLNDDSREETIYSPNKKDHNNPDRVIVTPVRRYRESLKPILRQFGIDKAEQDKIHDTVFSKEHSEALMDAAGHILKAYIDTGRKFVFPITSKKEAQSSISKISVDKKVSPTRVITQDADGKYISMPTGKCTITEPHSSIKASNKIPSWLKSSKQL